MTSIHISFDDVYACMKELTEHEREYASLFEASFFGWLKRMHDRYGAVFTLNTFNCVAEDRDYDISDFPPKYAGELRASAGWLKFAFHAGDDRTKYLKDDREAVRRDYDKFISAILTATEGNESSIDLVTRLGFYEGTLENLRELRDGRFGIRGFLTADNSESRRSYYFDDETVRKVNQKGYFRDEQEKLLFLKTQLRMENVTSLEEQLEGLRRFPDCRMTEVFTHEGCFYQNSKVPGYTVQELLEKYMEKAVELGHGFAYAREVYGL